MWVAPSSAGPLNLVERPRATNMLYPVWYMFVPALVTRKNHMADTNTAVFGIYRSVTDAELAVDQIVEFRTVAGGFTHNDISVLLPDARSTQEFAHEKNTKAPEGTTAGVT